MELVGELILTASLALFLSFLVAKLVAMAMAGDVAAGGSDSDFKSSTIADEGVVEAGEEVRCEESLRRIQGFGSERRVDFVEEALVEKVDRLEEIGDEGLGERERSESVGLVGKIVSDGEEALFADDSVEEGLEKSGVDEIGVESVTVTATNDVVPHSSEEVGVLSGELEGKEEGNKVELRNIGGDDDDDDWEGIERNELENDFVAAVKFVESGAEDGGDRLAKVGRDVQVELYGLSKVAMEGPCHEVQPQAIDVSAQAKWNAWQRLGNLSPEMAMEQYITILSDKVPGWMESHFAGEDKLESTKEEVPNSIAGDVSALLHHPQNRTNEREPELKSGAEPERVDFTGASDLENRVTG